MFMDREAAIHFIGGAVGGTAGTAITCPLEVVKTRMQSSRGLDTQSGPSTSSGGSSSSKSSSSSSSTTSKSSGIVKSVTSARNGFGSNFRGQFALERIFSGNGGLATFSRSNGFFCELLAMFAQKVLN
uniref:Mitochondrial carrier protein n=1 Tax=Caenorhabditis japonica TaxID=281687 RepID=A0A8R1IHI6_CAEJA